MLRNEEEARDVVQEAFLRVYRALSTFDQSRKFSTWILRITTNLCIDHIRRRKVRTLSIDVDPRDEERVPVILVDKRPGPQERYGQTSLGELLDEMILQLPPIYRAVVELRYTEQLSYEEIAQVLEIPLGTVKARLHRAHHQLKDRLLMAGFSPEVLGL
jgi:RNA polymerase sigma-70 factor (ECF subfamily)